MAAFQTVDYESDLSDNEEEGGQEVTGWLDEDDPEPEPAPVVVKAPEPPKIDVIHKPQYIVKNLDLYFALCEVEDFEFEQFPDEHQEELMKTLIIEVYQPGQKIITEGDIGNDMYFVVATDETAHLAEVEVVNQNILAGTEVFLTRLKRGQYFGQKYFLTRRANKRGATIRVPVDATVKVEIAKLTPEYFDKWESFRNLLLVKTVPLIQKLPRKERMTILQNLTIREFKDGEYICRQGEIGEEFFIIQDGSVKVVEKRPSPDRGWDSPIDVTLVTLREGHFFGEMSLVTDEPRVASVISVRNTICLCLSKSVFRSALSDETFNEVLSEVLSKRKEIRKQREKEAEQQNQMSSPSLMGSSPSMRKFSVRSRQSSNGATEVSISTTLSMKKLESGSRVINKYIVERELGKGSFGEVYLCRDQETDENYAMKMIARPQASWNDDSSNSIRQEIAVLKRLKHNNVVALHEVIDDPAARKIFLIQEFMEGGALMPDAETCDPVDMKTARKYFRDILRGVCYLHSEGIVHRDIKPQNMLLSADGVVKIADFGAAVFTGEQGKVAFGGTPAFMAPELFLSSTKNQDFTKSPRIDIFALGATLYYMVVGRPPWMAKNQIDLANKIKNFELTFPAEGIDPHLKHLLKQMLAKDYRTRCDLDTVVVDDWVTFEGSEPLFEKDEYLCNEFDNYASFIANEDPFNEPIHCIIVHASLVIRTMLHQQINNNVQPCMTAAAATAEEAISIISTTMQTHPNQNFEYIFFELLCPDRQTSYNAIKEIRFKLGYQGIIIGMTTSDDENFDDFVRDGLVQVVINRPIANRELSALLSSDAFISMQDKVVINNTASIDKISREELEQSITYNSNALGTLTRTPSAYARTTPSRSASGNNQPFHPNSGMGAAKDSNDSLIADDENLTDYFASPVRKESSTPDMNRLSLSDNRGGLSRKRGFMVVPYGNSGSSEIGENSGSQNLNYDRPLKVFSLQNGNPNNGAGLSRREKREKALRHSEIAQQYRQAKKLGDEKALSSSRSLLNSFRLQNKKSMRSLKSQRPSGGFDVGKPPISPHSHSSLDLRLQQDVTFVKSASTEDNSMDWNSDAHLEESEYGDSVIEETLDDEEGGGGHHSHHGHSAHGKSARSAAQAHLIDEDIMEVEDEDEDTDEHSEDDESSEEEDDFGVTADDIIQVDDDNFNSVFDDMMTKKPADNEMQELAEWNHVMIGVELIGKLGSPPDLYNPTLNLRCGKNENIVSRSYMEDRTYISTHEWVKTRSNNRLDVAIFGVFDGHNGDYVAQFLQDNYGSTFLKFFNQMEERTEFVLNDFMNGNYEHKISEVFEQTNANIDREVLLKDFIRQQKSLKAGISKEAQKFAGSVGVVAVVLPSRVPIKQLNTGQHTSRPTLSGIYSAQQVFISHVGDCRAVLSHDGTAVPLTEDHKPTMKSEKNRIEAAGGWVDKDRVTGALGVSRSFGDIEYKNFAKCLDFNGTDEMGAGGIWGVEQQVISKPDFKHFILERSYEFMILACDGLWDRFSCQEAVNFVRKKLLQVKDVNKVAQLLVEKAIQRGTMDNTSVVIVAFHQ